MVLGGLTAGLIKRTTETDLEKLWVEHNSRVVEERLYFNQRYMVPENQISIQEDVVSGLIVGYHFFNKLVFVFNYHLRTMILLFL